MDPRVSSAREAKSKRNKEILSKAFNEVVGAQLKKAKEKTSKISDIDEELYRKKLEEERESALKKSGKRKLTQEHKMLAQSTGLSGQVVALMGGMNSSDDESNEQRDRKRRKKSKHKKHKDRKHHKHKKKKSAERK